METTTEQIKEVISRIRGGRISDIWEEGGSILMAVDDQYGIRIAVAEITPEELEFTLAPLESLE